jgi:tRNA A-37 threonylcarbamoyl transferase component Bud32
MKPSNQPICPKCAAIIPDEAPGGLCPKCALEGAATVSNTPSGGRHITPPGIAEIAPHFPELEILELIGAGGMGAVYKARQPQLDRYVALKILSHDLAGDPAFVERFNREARVLARLSHPNIVGIHDFGTAGPYCFLTMELVDGVNLRQAMQAGRFTPSEALAMVQHLCSALAYAHAEGILHRDIKPENILIDSKGRVKIADFGIAKLVGEDRGQDFTLTLQGLVLGSPHYMAPEQIETPGDVDQRADIYSLGVVLYEMLTGGLPLGRFALPSEKAAMDARIDHIVMRTLEKEREARYQSAGEVGTEVEALGKSPAPIRSGRTPAVVGSGVAQFSLLSPILTGLSLVLATVLVAINISVNASRMPGQAPYIITGTPMFLFGLPAAITGIIGFILGARALAEIRRSGGVKTGLGSAIFAITAWPILAFLAVGQLFMITPSPGEGGSIGPFMVIIVVVLPVVLSAWILVRSLYRWAAGVERSDGTRFHPGPGIPVLMAMLLAIGGPMVLAEIAVRILPNDNEILVMVRPEPGSPDRPAVLSKPTEARGISKSSGSSVPASVGWRLGAPEVRIPVSLQAGLEVKFRLIRSADENRLQTTGLGVLAHRAGTGELNFATLYIGTTVLPDKGGAVGLMAVVQSDENRKDYVDLDFREWEFAFELPEELVLSEPGVSEHVIATKGIRNPETAEQLVLHAVVTKLDD